MNIFLCCLQSNLCSHHFWRENFKTSLEAMGHTMFEPEGLDFLEPFEHLHDYGWMKKQRSRTSEELVRQVKQADRDHGIDLLFTYFWSFHVHPEAIREIEKTGIPTVNYFCDNLREFESVSDLINHYTINWVPEKKACEFYLKRRAPFIHLPMSADPNFYRPAFGAEVPQVTFIGAADHMRAEIVESLVNSDLPVKVYGRNWSGNGRELLNDDVPTPIESTLSRIGHSVRQHWSRLRAHGIGAEWRHFADRKYAGPPLTQFQHIAQPSIRHSEMVNLTSNSAVVLGVNRCPHPAYTRDMPLVYSRLRDVEAPMMGACYLTEYCEDVEELYEIGEEVAVYRNREELISECQRLLGDSMARRVLKKNGHNAARSRHTWEKRFEKLFSTLGLPQSRVMLKEGSLQANAL